MSMVRILILGILLGALIGCFQLPKEKEKPTEEVTEKGVEEVGEVGVEEEVTEEGVEVPEILDINESEGDFPLPV